jgi:RNA polymerase sigma-70 factor (ECF subfamily)
VPDLEDALTRARAGDADAMAELYRAYAGPLLGFLGTQVRRRQDAEDLLGEVFLSAVKDLPRFSGDLGGFRSWLYKIAVNRAIDFARRVGRRPEEPLTIAEDAPGDMDIEDAAIERAERRRLWDAIASLPEQQRRIITLRLTAGLTSAEIGRMVGKRAGAVKALQHRALANLSRALRGTPYPSPVPGRLED